MKETDRRSEAQRRERQLRDREADGYRVRYRREKGPWWDDLEISLLTRAMPCERAARVLDAGAGVGRITGALARRGCHVDAYDVSLTSLRVLQRDERPLDPRIRAVVCDLARGLPVAAAVYDGAVSGQTIHHLPERDWRLTAWRDIARACLPGAVLAATVYHKKPWQTSDGVYPNGPAFHRYTVTDLAGELAEAGWRVRTVRLCYRFEWKRVPGELARLLDGALARAHLLDDRATYVHAVAVKPSP